ncbi:LOW QUALITY PROTEIN: hypothetical protein HID58_060695, partial [Brassica napus]
QRTWRGQAAVVNLSVVKAHGFSEDFKLWSWKRATVDEELHPRCRCHGIEYMLSTEAVGFAGDRCLNQVVVSELKIKQGMLRVLTPFNMVDNKLHRRCRCSGTGLKTRSSRRKDAENEEEKSYACDHNFF